MLSLPNVSHAALYAMHKDFLLLLLCFFIPYSFHMCIFKRLLLEIEREGIAIVLEYVKQIALLSINRRIRKFSLLPALRLTLYSM